MNTKIINNFLNPSDIKYIVVHCSDTPDEDNLNACDIHKMHISFGWEGIGYHKIILRSGEIESGRPEYWVGAHAFGINNISLGVCLIGQKKFKKAQLNSLKKVILDWKYKFPSAIIKGHKDAILTSKTCPNFDVNQWLLLENIKND